MSHHITVRKRPFAWLFARRWRWSCTCGMGGFVPKNTWRQAMDFGCIHLRVQAALHGGRVG